MGFVFRSKKDFNLSSGIPDVGPGSYDNLKDKNFGKLNKNK